MKDYIFIYRDSLNHFEFCTNPKFIAEQKYCRGILEAELEELNIKPQALKNYLNKYDIDPYSEKIENAIDLFNLRNLVNMSI